MSKPFHQTSPILSEMVKLLVTFTYVNLPLCGFVKSLNELDPVSTSAKVLKATDMTYKVLFPEPLGPTKATYVSGSTVTLNPFKMRTSGREGYRKDTSRIWTFPVIVRGFSRGGFSACAGSLQEFNRGKTSRTASMADDISGTDRKTFAAFQEPNTVL